MLLYSLKPEKWNRWTVKLYMYRKVSWKNEQILKEFNAAILIVAIEFSCRTEHVVKRPLLICLEVGHPPPQHMHFVLSDQNEHTCIKLAAIYSAQSKTVLRMINKGTYIVIKRKVCKKSNYTLKRPIVYLKTSFLFEFILRFLQAAHPLFPAHPVVLS